MAVDETLRNEISRLGRQFGEVIRQIEGDQAFELIERIRGEARQFRDGDMAAGERLDELLPTLANEDLELIVGAFAGFLELANLAEDRQRVRSLRERQLNSHPQPRKESIRDAIRSFKHNGLTAGQVQEALDGVDVELVFTAHPTEAKRRSLRSKLRAMRDLLAELDNEKLLPSDRANTEAALRREILKLWQTSLIRPSRPTVLEEVERGLLFQPVLWETAPQMLAELRAALAEFYPHEEIDAPPLLRFGSWMGGDRDGHPHVTPEITEQTIEWLRAAALEDHLASCFLLLDSLSMTCHDEEAIGPLVTAINEAASNWPEINERLADQAPLEKYRQWLRVMQWRLEQTAATTVSGPWPAGAYNSAADLRDDVERLADAVYASGNTELVDSEIQSWLDQIDVFGFTTARLDLRQHSEVYASVMEEVWLATRIIEPGELPLSEDRRCELLQETLPAAPNLAPVGLSHDAEKTLNLFRVVRRVARRFGMAALGGHVVSMTSNPSDLLTILWLWKWSERTDTQASSDASTTHGPEHDTSLAERDAQLHLPIIPLFETIDDLKNGTDILTRSLAVPEYRQHVTLLDDEQIVMIGYSDSTKDGGYLAAAWGLQRCQMDIFKAAQEAGVHVTFFHGRGGSLGRGGGPAARAILSLPGDSFDGSLRLTEQGEVLAERYDDPAIGHRHLEQVVWSVLMAATHTASPELDEWRAAMDHIAGESWSAYRGLVDHEAFVPFFRTATPIAGIERLPIGSRPSRRKDGGRIEDLRAIPWVFSWTQARCLLPAWYGLGSAMVELIEADPAAKTKLQAMYRDWPFFKATIDNSALAVAKSNLPVFRRYVDHAATIAEAASAEEGEPVSERSINEVAQMIYDEYLATRQAVLAVTGLEELLDDIPWLQRSIIVRNGYVDPLNFVQVEVMRRAAELDESSDEAERLELESLTQMAIKGVAAGMRTTG